jgi:hypothetical protein
MLLQFLEFLLAVFMLEKKVKKNSRLHTIQHVTTHDTGYLYTRVTGFWTSLKMKHSTEFHKIEINICSGHFAWKYRTEPQETSIRLVNSKFISGNSQLVCYTVEKYQKFLQLITLTSRPLFS